MAKTYTYKNTSDQDLVLPNIGVVEAGKTITLEDEINNPNLLQLKEVKEAKTKSKDKE